MFSLCFIPLVIGFLQVMLFFAYQHISNFMAHETLICLDEYKSRANSHKQIQCEVRLKKILKRILFFTQPDAHEFAQINPMGNGRKNLQIHWRLGLFRFNKTYH